MNRTACLIAVALALVACDKQKKPSAPDRPDAELAADAVEEPAEQATPRAPSLSSNPIRRFADVHTHLNPFAYPLFVRIMDELGIYRIVNLSGGADPEVRRENLARADRFQGRIALFYNVDWSKVNEPNFAQKEAAGLREAVERGFAGLKISKALGLAVRDAKDKLIAVDDPRLDPLWQAAGDLGVPVSIHTGDPRAFFEKPGPTNERNDELSLAPGWSFHGDQFPSREELLAQRDRMIAKHPDTTFILVHFAGNPEDVEYVDQLLGKYPNVYLDIAARIGEFGRHDAATMRDFFTRHADRILFATDFMLGVFPAEKGEKPSYQLTLGSISQQPPTIDDIAPFYRQHWAYFEREGEPIPHPIPIQGKWGVHPVDLPEEVLAKIYWRNAERLVFAPWLARRAAQDVIAVD